LKRKVGIPSLRILREHLLSLFFNVSIFNILGITSYYNLLLVFFVVFVLIAEVALGI